MHKKYPVVTARFKKDFDIQLLDKKAKAVGMNRSQFIQLAIENALRMDTEKIKQLGGDKI